MANVVHCELGRFALCVVVRAPIVRGVYVTRTNLRNDDKNLPHCTASYPRIHKSSCVITKQCDSLHSGCISGSSHFFSSTDGSIYVYEGRLRLKCDGTCAETRFRLSTKRTSLFKSPGRQFGRLLAAEVCASAVVMLDTTCSE